LNEKLQTLNEACLRDFFKKNGLQAVLEIVNEKAKKDKYKIIF
jgi:hypothetical protein